MEVVRKQPITEKTMQRNRAYWGLPEIRGTIWENYMLVMTQFPKTPGKVSIKNPGDPFPVGVASTLANTTMETYQQKDGSSCMECHDVVSNQRGGDFVAFMFFDADDPVQAAIARSVSFERTSATTSKKSAPKSDLQKTVLDDHPSISALARFLREVNGR